MEQVEGSNEFIIWPGIGRQMEVPAVHPELTLATPINVSCDSVLLYLR